MCSERWLRMMTGSWKPTTLRVRYGDRMVDSFTITSTGLRVLATDDMNPGKIYNNHQKFHKNLSSIPKYNT